MGHPVVFMIYKENGLTWTCLPWVSIHWTKCWTTLSLTSLHSTALSCNMEHEVKFSAGSLDFGKRLSDSEDQRLKVRVFGPYRLFWFILVSTASIRTHLYPFVFSRPQRLRNFKNPSLYPNSSAPRPSIAKTSTAHKTVAINLLILTKK